ncbi:hypothetical protein Ahy_A10g047605 [Arachis hypogaea]|uniref:SWIM-type domain-containing protein n=1 Tax=Arachis hypogaea TaxID=3818 RepID=A0A445B331_ARAHY|nr:hypothetical protein Ahy_A10g047605 [Arachis hypogaea]
MNSDSKEDFEATYEAGDEDEDGDVGVETAVENIVVHLSSSVADLEDGKFQIGMEYNSRKSVIAVIRSYTISRGIDYNVYESEPQTFYAKCKINFLRAFKIPHLQKLVVNIGYSRTVEEYNINYKRLEDRGKAYARWCDAVGLRHLLAFDEGHRWGHITTNIVECINSRIEKNMQQAVNIVMHRFDRRNEVFEVREMTSAKVLVVDLAPRSCDCGHFQVERLPCHHVIACCANQHLDWQLYVNDVYKMTEVHKVYRFKFTQLSDPETWPAYKGPTLVANPASRRTSKGRPKLTRYLNKMDSRDMCGPQICRFCGAQGYSRSRCPQRAGPSGAGE